jgi:hypothetical protein
VDPTYISAFAALAGSAIGSVGSLAASWLSQSAQARVQLITASRQQRYDLYKAFVEEASRLYADALTHDEPQIANIVGLYTMANIVGLYTMVSRMRIVSTPQVVGTAEAVVQNIISTYFTPTPHKTYRELHAYLTQHNVDPLREFGEACREDLIKTRNL